MLECLDPLQHNATINVYTEEVINHYPNKQY
jgi:hypothetical protein